MCVVQVMTRLLQRYKYLKKGLEEEMKKILKFLKGFEEKERQSLAIYTGLLLAEVLVPASVLSSLLRSGGVLRGCGPVQANVSVEAAIPVQRGSGEGGAEPAVCDTGLPNLADREGHCSYQQCP